MKISVLTFFMLLCFRGFSQEKFIEVTVSDTVWVKADFFTYRISVYSEDDDSGADTTSYFDPVAYQQKRKQKQQQRKTVLETVRLLIKKNGYQIISPNIDEVFLFNEGLEFKSNSIVIITGSIDSLRNLYNLVSGNKALQANVESYFAKDESAGHRYLYKKLLTQAEKNATTIASLSGRKLGKLVSVIENAGSKTESPRGWTIYPPLSAMMNANIPGWHTTIEGSSVYDLTKDEISTAYLIRNTLTIRFALE